jgi:hypothetical protein
VKVVMALLVRDEADILDAHVAYHLNAGVDLIVATDHASRDGSREILESYEREGHVRLIREAGEQTRRSAWMTRMARLAAAEHEADWVLLSDADEFWWPREGSLEEVLAAVPETYGSLHAVIRPFVPVPADGRLFAERMTLRLAPSAPVDGTAAPFRPAAKPALRASPHVVVGPGDRELSGLAGPHFGWSPIELLHFPLRSPEQCAREHPGEQASSLWDRAVVDEVARGRGLADGSLVSDTRLRDALRMLVGETEAREGELRRLVTPRAGSRLVFPRPSLADDAGYAVEAAVLREAMVVGAVRHLDQLERRLSSLESARKAGPLRRRRFSPRPRPRSGTP